MEQAVDQSACLFTKFQPISDGASIKQVDLIVIVSKQNSNPTNQQFWISVHFWAHIVQIWAIWRHFDQLGAENITTFLSPGIVFIPTKNLFLELQGLKVRIVP